MALTINNFEVPNWAGKPPPGLHLDVLKEGKMIQKLMLDEKKCYFFGRNKQMCDVCIDHSSCSRVHAVLIWHKHLSRPFIVDLGSTHGTMIGTLRLEHKKPQQVPLDSEIHFGASTRRYVIRERPQTQATSGAAGGEDREEIEGGLLGLPETETELDNLTEFNTAHNRRITSLSELNEPVAIKRKRKSTHVQFNEEEEIINPEDIDPSIGRFRNLVQTTVIPSKRARLEGMGGGMLTGSFAKRLQDFHYRAAAAGAGLYGDEGGAPGEAGLHPGAGLGGLPAGGAFSVAAKLGLKMPNLAPDVEAEPRLVPQRGGLPAAPSSLPGPGAPGGGGGLLLPPGPAPHPAPPGFHATLTEIEATPNPLEPKKKKYAKEAWPGKKPMPSLLV